MKSLLTGFVGGLLAFALAIGVAWYMGALDKPADQVAKVEPVVTLTPATPPVPVAPGEVKATSFVLVDATGKVRGQIGIIKDGAFLSLTDSVGKPKILMGVDDDKARMLVQGRGGSNAGIAVYNAAPVMVLTDANGTQRVIQGILPSGDPWIALHDANGQQTWSTDRR